VDKPAILIIDDETNLLRFFEYTFGTWGYDAVTGETAEDMRRLLGETNTPPCCST
jgi:DNA-binding NtrC family response regulator